MSVFESPVAANVQRRSAKKQVDRVSRRSRICQSWPSRDARDAVVRQRTALSDVPAPTAVYARAGKHAVVKSDGAGVAKRGLGPPRRPFVTTFLFAEASFKELAGRYIRSTSSRFQPARRHLIMQIGDMAGGHACHEVEYAMATQLSSSSDVSDRTTAARCVQEVYIFHGG